MACQGLSGDYLCNGWRARAAAIRARDGGRCRGCNRGEEAVRLEVHHRLYGAPGPCGACVLTGVADEDLLTLCVECHDAITNVRRTARFAALIRAPHAHPEPTEAPALSGWKDTPCIAP